MLEKDFAQLYRRSQEQMHAPAELIATSLATAHKTLDDNQKHQKQRQLTNSRSQWLQRIAACLILAVILVGGSMFFARGLSPEQSQSHAYAKMPNLLTAELDSGIVPFDLDSHTGLQGWGDGDLDGSFTGFQFTLDGNDIARIQATISRGELYQITTETYDRTTDEGVAILNEAYSWKVLSRGLGDYLAEYDWVTLYSVDDGLDRNDVNHKTQLRLIKRIGSTIDMPYEDKPLTLGLWFNDLDFLEDGRPDLRCLDGTELTITAEYNDGSYRTQVMTLHDGWFTLLSTNPAQGADAIMAEGPYQEEPESSTNQDLYYSPMQTLYGKVISITDEPHPYSLEDANKPAENASVDAFLKQTLGPRGSGTLIVEDIPSKDCVKRQDAAVDFAWWGDDWGSTNTVDLRLSNVSAYAREELGTQEYIKPSEGKEVISFRYDYDYLNRIRMWTNGWSITEDGKVDDENSLVMLSVDITNDRDESVKIYPDSIGTAICTIDTESNMTVFATAREFAIKDSKGRLWDRSSNYELWLEPHETLTLSCVFIVDDTIANANEVYWALGVQNYGLWQEFNADIDDITYVSLGKLEWRH